VIWWAGFEIKPNGRRAGISTEGGTTSLVPEMKVDDDMLRH